MPFEQSAFAGCEVPISLQPVVAALAQVGAELAERIARGPLEEDLARPVGENADGDEQKALDILADRAFMSALAAAGLGHYASEEQPEARVLNRGGALALAIDPLDGSSNIDANVSIGTIFSIYPAGRTPEESFLRPGREQIAAGYIVYGPQCCLVASFGQGVCLYILDPLSHQFRLVKKTVQLPATSREFAINASNYRHWTRPVRSYIDDCLAGEEGPLGQNFNMRWIASLVAEAHRILMRGGLFLYPADARRGYAQGRLRLLYEAAPIAYLIAQAGGGATDGADSILAQRPRDLHQRTPLVFGCAERVARVAAYHDLPEEESAALFAARGLFRS